MFYGFHCTDDVSLQKSATEMAKIKGICQKQKLTKVSQQVVIKIITV